MDMQELEYQVNQEHEVAVITLHGDIGAASEHALNSAYGEAARQNPDAIQLDFADVGYINSAGIALLVGLMAQARKSSRRFLVQNLKPHYRDLSNDPPLRLHDHGLAH